MIFARFCESENVLQRQRVCRFSVRENLLKVSSPKVWWSQAAACKMQGHLRPSLTLQQYSAKSLVRLPQFLLKSAGRNSNSCIRLRKPLQLLPSGYVGTTVNGPNVKCWLWSHDCEARFLAGQSTSPSLSAVFGFPSIHIKNVSFSCQVWRAIGSSSRSLAS